MDCPRGHGPLEVTIEHAAYDRVEVDVCNQCQGVWFDRSELAALLQVPNKELFSPDSPLLDGEHASLACPRNPEARMRERVLRTQDANAGHVLRLDQCDVCEGVWLDGGELRELQAALSTETARPFLVDPDTARMKHAGLYLFMFFTGLPVEQWNPRAKKVVVMPAIVALCVLVFGLQLVGGVEATCAACGLVPATFFAGKVWPLFTHMFMHAGFVHLLGNLYFLWILGDNVEERLGRARFLALYLVSGTVAALLHATMSFGGLADEPMIGASGAIAGVMGAYALLFPRARLISVLLFWRVRWRSTTYMAIWLGLNVLGVLSKVQAVAWWAHIGGLLTGVALARAMRGPAKRAVAVAAVH